MKMKNKLFFIALTTLFIFSSCGMIIKSYIRKDTENVPPDFGKEKTTMLVLQERKGYTKKIKKILNDNYSGDYVFVTREELKTKYSDAEKYRYILDDDITITRRDVITITHTTDLNTGFTTTDAQNRSTASRSFHILDRKSNKIHDTGVSSGTSWKTILKSYLKKLDSERKKNGGN
jgi:hypothetical protein